MKQKDIVTIIVVVFASAVISLVISNLLISTPNNRRATVEVVDPITQDFKLPDNRYFNSKSIDPTQTIQIGGNQNPQPFSGN